jgi:hypothetical protein
MIFQGLLLYNYMKTKIRNIFVILAASLALVLNVGFAPISYASSATTQLAEAEEGECTSLLPSSWCSKDNGDGIFEIIHMVVRILVAGVGVVGTIGIIWCGFIILSARDNEAQVAQAKRRLIDIVIGIAIFGLAGLLVELFLPGGETAGFF